MATIQKRKNKNGSNSYRIMIRPNDGLPTTYKTFPTYQEAKEWALQEEARRRQGIYFPEQTKKKHTLTELIDRYCELILPGKIKSSEDMFRHLNWWKSHIGKFTLNHITPDLIAKYRKELLEGKTQKGGLRTPATANRYMASLSSVLSYGVKECGWISVNPMLRVSKLKEPKGRDRVLTKEECDGLLTACAQSKNPFLLIIVVLAINTGMRQGEILGLTWHQVNLEQGLVSLTETKSGHARSIPLVSPSLEHLQTLFAQRNPHHPLVFPSRKRFGRICIRKAWEEASTRAGISNLRFHDLRHTFATIAAKSGASNLELATAMGHRTLQMLQRYTHLDVNHTRRLSEFVAAHLMPAEEANGSH